MCPTAAAFPKKGQSILDICMLNRMFSIGLIFLSTTKNTDQLCKMRNQVIPLWFCHSFSGAFPQNCFPKKHLQKLNSYLTELSDTSRDTTFYLLTIMGLLKFVVSLNSNRLHWKTELGGSFQDQTISAHLCKNQY